jgi:hypothetical protein
MAMKSKVVGGQNLQDRSRQAYPILQQLQHKILLLEKDRLGYCKKLLESAATN